MAPSLLPRHLFAAAASLASLPSAIAHPRCSCSNHASQAKQSHKHTGVAGHAIKSELFGEVPRSSPPSHPEVFGVVPPLHCWALLLSPSVSQSSVLGHSPGRIGLKDRGEPTATGVRKALSCVPSVMGRFDGGGENGTRLGCAPICSVVCDNNPRSK